MSTFGNRFNQWLIERGKEPVDQEMVELLNRAADTTANYIEENRAAFGDSLRFFMAELLQQEYKIHEGRWWLWSLGKPVRLLTDVEITEHGLGSEIDDGHRSD